MNLKECMVFKVPVMVIFLELGTERKSVGYRRPRYVNKLGRWKLKHQRCVGCLQHSPGMFLKARIGIWKLRFAFSWLFHTNKCTALPWGAAGPDCSLGVLLLSQCHQPRHSWSSKGGRPPSDLVCAPFSRCERMRTAQRRVWRSLLWKRGRLLPVCVRGRNPGVQPHDRAVPLPGPRG